MNLTKYESYVWDSEDFLCLSVGRGLSIPYNVCTMFTKT